MDNGGKAATAFLLGVIAGGVAGILFAPKTGRETREEVSRYMKDAEGKLSGSLSKTKDELIKAKDGLKKAKDEIKKRVDKTFRRADDAEDSIESSNELS